MAEVWLLTLQIALLGFVISTVTAALIWLVRVVLGKTSGGRKGAKK